MEGNLNGDFNLIKQHIYKNLQTKLQEKIDTSKLINNFIFTPSWNSANSFINNYVIPWMNMTISKDNSLHNIPYSLFFMIKDYYKFLLLYTSQIEVKYNLWEPLSELIINVLSIEKITNPHIIYSYIEILSLIFLNTEKQYAKQLF